MRAFSLILGALLLSSCSLLVSFDPESQPCDSLARCRSGYVCVITGDAGVCKASDGGVEDAGVDAGCVGAARETRCGDGLDDDCDMQVDCLDTDCAGLGCDDRDPCTTGETCGTGGCRGGTTVVCNTPPNACVQQVGTCSSAMGGCFYAPLPDGASCGATAAARCCGGTCKNLSVLNTDCGGCGITCSSGQFCTSINQSMCGTEPADTSARCTCGVGINCPNGQICTNGFCMPTDAGQCAPGQRVVSDGGTNCGTYCRY